MGDVIIRIDFNKSNIIVLYRPGHEYYDNDFNVMDYVRAHYYNQEELREPLSYTYISNGEETKLMNEYDVIDIDEDSGSTYTKLLPKEE